MKNEFLNKKDGVIDYQGAYDHYWSRPDRIGKVSCDVEQFANYVVNMCGSFNILDIGSGEEALLSELVKLGVDAVGLDVSNVSVQRANSRLKGRSTVGTVLSLPYGDESFHTVVSTDCMEHLAPSDVLSALVEIHRVTKRFVFLQIATTIDRDKCWHLTIEGRAWWERRCFEAGFRKHPLYYKINEYQALNSDPWQIYILLEKIPLPILARYPLSMLEAERGLHMDMTRDTGERSDAHIIRYQWACDYIKPGDRVLDAACGLGYGGHVIRHLSHSAKVVGIDESEYAIDYAKELFPCEFGRAEYLIGSLPECLSQFDDNSFDVVVSFETLEHVEQPTRLLEEFHRILTPGGRIMVSVPNDWSDETGSDPNPYHLHVYNWNRLKYELCANFVVENAYAQTASQCKVATENGKYKWEKQPRSLKPVSISASTPPENCEWWLMTAMKSPLKLAHACPYKERVFANILNSNHPSIQYKESYSNPWLMHSLVNFNYRLKDPEVLELLVDQVIQNMPTESNDYAAALCVKAYKILECSSYLQTDYKFVFHAIEQYLNRVITDPMGIRWKVSLLFVKAKLLQSVGQLEEAIKIFVECYQTDIRDFGIHLATKTTESFYWAGRISRSLGNSTDARQHWQRGIDYGCVLLDVDLNEILINPDFPNLFHHGDGIREYTVAWDNIARCANGIHLMNSSFFDNAASNCCHQTEYRAITTELISTRQTLAERTETLEKVAQDLRERTADLVETRQTLVERTETLEKVAQDLRERTADLVETRQTLVERTGRLESLFRYLKNKTTGKK